MPSLNDLRQAARMLVKSPGFSAIAVLALALGIGANTAIFSVVNAVVLRPFAYREPGRLVLVGESIPKLGGPILTVPAPDAVDFQNQTGVFDAVASFHGTGYELSGRGQPVQLKASRVSASLFPLLGVNPILGRTFTEEEDKSGSRVAVLSFSLWQQSFGGDRDVVGQTATLSRLPYTIIGVMPRSFAFPTPGLAIANPAEIWVPMSFRPDELPNRGDNFDYGVIARMKPGVALPQANSDVNSIAAGIQELYPPQMREDLNLTAYVMPLQEAALGRVRTLAALLLGAVGLVLLIACANVANLLLTRAADRQREIAIRRALGAGRLRLLRQFITESLLLALVGGAAGLALAYWGTSVLASLAPPSIPRADQIQLDSTVLMFTVALSLVTGLIFGTAPAFAASSINLSETLKEGGRSSKGIRHRRLRNLVIISEIALATVLLVGAGLLIRSFFRVRETDPGFRPHGVLTMSIGLPGASYSKPEQVRAFYQELLNRLRGASGIDSIGFSTDLPMLAGWTRIFSPEGWQPGPGEQLNIGNNCMVMGDYFETMGIPLIRGRYFDDRDRVDSEPVVIISESIARRFWAEEDPIGKRLKWGPPQSSSPWLTIVGVVGEVKPAALDQAMRAHTYEPYLQASGGLGMFGPYNIAVRASSGGRLPVSPPVDPTTLAGTVRAVVSGLDSQLAVSNVRTMSQVADRSIAPRRFNTFLLSVFAAAALLLSAVGIYGVIGYSVTQRSHEIGVRIALGAERKDVVLLILRQAVLLAAIGVGSGLAGAVGLTRFLSTLLYEIRPIDLPTMAAVAVLLAAVACLASFIPAHRATRLDPVAALRFE